MQVRVHSLRSRRLEILECFGVVINLCGRSMKKEILQDRGVSGEMQKGRPERTQKLTMRGGGLGERLLRLMKGGQGSSKRKGPPTESLRIARPRRQRRSSSSQRQSYQDAGSYGTENRVFEGIEAWPLDEARRRISPERHGRRRTRSVSRGRRRRTSGSRHSFLAWQDRSRSGSAERWRRNALDAGEENAAGRVVASRAACAEEDVARAVRDVPTRSHSEEELFARIFEEERALDPVLMGDRVGR